MPSISPNRSAGPRRSGASRSENDEAMAETRQKGIS